MGIHHGSRAPSLFPLGKLLRFTFLLRMEQGLQVPFSDVWFRDSRVIIFANYSVSRVPLFNPFLRSNNSRRCASPLNDLPQTGADLLTSIPCSPSLINLAFLSVIIRGLLPPVATTFNPPERPTSSKVMRASLFRPDRFFFLPGAFTSSLLHPSTNY